jgi:sugar phosphate permease
MGFGIVDEARAIGRGLWREGRGWVLILVAMGWVLSLGTRYVFPVLFPAIRADLDIGLSTLGVLYTLLWVAYAVGQFPGGIIADRFGDRNTLVASTAVTAVTVLAIGLAVNAFLLAVGMVLFGLATALYGPVRFTVLSGIYDEYEGTAIGITQAAGQLGNALLPVGANAVAAYLTWQAGLLCVLPLFAVVTVGLWLVVPTRSAESSSAVDDLSTETLRYVLRHVTDRRPLALAGVLAITMFVLQGMSGFYPTYLADVKGLSSGDAALLYGLFFSSAVVVQPVAGSLGDLLSKRRTLLVGLGPLSLGLSLLPFASGRYQLTAVTVLLGSIFFVTPVAIPMLMATLPADIEGTGLGLLRTGYFLFGATGTTVVGVLADRGSFDESFLVLTALLLVAVLLVAVLPDPDG